VTNNTVWTNETDAAIRARLGIEEWRDGDACDAFASAVDAASAAIYSAALTFAHHGRLGESREIRESEFTASDKFAANIDTEAGARAINDIVEAIKLALMDRAYAAQRAQDLATDFNEVPAAATWEHFGLAMRHLQRAQRTLMTQFAIDCFSR
jgi:hypothetical protein